MKRSIFIFLLAFIMTACTTYLVKNNSKSDISNSAVDSVYIYGTDRDFSTHRNILYLEKNNNKFTMYADYPVFGSFGFGRWWHHGDSLVLYFIPSKDFITLITRGYGGLNHRLLIGVKCNNGYKFNFKSQIRHVDSIYNFKLARVMTRDDSSQIYPPYPNFVYEDKRVHIDSIPFSEREKILKNLLRQ